MGSRSRTLRNDPHFGLDSRRSWLIAVFLSFVLAMTIVGQQSAGVLFYGIVHTFGVSRQEASWPMALPTTMTCLSGPLMGYCCNRYTCRAVLLICTVLAGTSVSACCFVNDIVTLSVLFGILYGLAVGGVYVAVNVIVSQYFDKRRATACSLIFTFSGINMVYVPYLAELSRVAYGIRGTFLLLGGVIFNACAPVYALKSPPWLKTERPLSTTQCSEAKGGVIVARSNEGLSFDSVPIRQSSNDEEDVLAKNSDLDIAENMHPGQTQLLDFAEQSSRNEPQTIQKNLGTTLEGLKKFASVKFAVNALSFAVLAFGMTTFLMIAVDLATDRGVEPSKAVLLVNAFAFADICVRPLSGLSIDFRVLSLEGMMFLGFLLQLIACEVLATLKSFPVMVAFAAIFGASSGCRFILVAPSLLKDFGMDSLPVMMGAVNFCIGFVLVTRPFLVGYWRDTLKAYDGLLHFTGGLNAVLVAVWAVQICTKKR